MDTAQFFAFVVAPGNFLGITQPRGKGMGTRMFPRSDPQSAAGYAAWAAKNNIDIWYSPASFRDAAPDEKKILRGDRTQANAQMVKCVWWDADIHRSGDNKKPGRTYADEAEAMAWVNDKLVSEGGVLPPNLVVNSGYGLHLYWVFTDALEPHEWIPYAEALKGALIHHGGKGDIGLSSDSARLLRIPGTFNCKVPDSPAPVMVLPQYSRSEYDNALLWRALSPYKTDAPVIKRTNAPLTGTPPALAQVRRGTSSNAAAQTDMPTRDRSFARIATKCEQVKQSLANGGDGDSYPLWYMGFISLTNYCSDGAHYAHEIGKHHPKYTQADTDTARQRAKGEQAHKGLGAPLCKTFNEARPGVCQSCRFAKRVATPLTLGVEGDDPDLPPGYRRMYGVIEHKVTDKDGSVDWIPVILGDVYEPVVYLVRGAYCLQFTYLGPDGREHSVSVDNTDIPYDAGRLITYFARYGVTIYDNAKHFGTLVMAWLNHLRAACAVRNMEIHPFGWSFNTDGSTNGFAVGGTLYKPDGTNEPAPGGDRQLVETYEPHGSLEKWKRACDLVLRNRPDLQIIVGVAFGAPLLEFTGHAGVILSCWSRDSGVGKTSALRVGTAVWAGEKAMLQLTDTNNAIPYQIGRSKVMPAFWDEVQVGKDEAKETIKLLFQLTQGREKLRLTSNVALRDGGNWKTIVLISANGPLMDHVIQERGNTDAGALRVFEYEITHPQMPLDTDAAPTIKLAETNYGHAGRIYAAWLAQNSDKARKLVAGLSKAIEKELSPNNGERFYIAGMACVLAGAAVASQLGLANFDRTAMYEFLKATFYELRAGRKQDLPVAGGKLDLERIFGRFITDHADRRMVSSSFPKAGHRDPRFKTEAIPLSMKPLVIHIGQRDRLIRFDKNVWQTWCRNKNYSPSDLQHQMELRWNAKEGRGILGAGTAFATGRMAYIELSTAQPELACYNYESASSATSSGNVLSVLDGGKPDVR
jgi:hypothetical protein